MKLNNNKRNVDFVRLYKENDYEKRSLNPVIVFAAILLTVAVIAVAYFMYDMYSENQSIKSQINDIEAYIYDPNNIKMVEEVNMKEDQILELQLVSDDLDSVYSIIDMYPNFNYEFVDRLNYDDIDITSMQYTTSALIIQAECNDLTDATNYVRYLKETELFFDVSFHGLSTSGSEENNAYQFSVEAVVARGDNNE